MQTKLTCQLVLKWLGSTLVRKCVMQYRAMHFDGFESLGFFFFVVFLYLVCFASNFFILFSFLFFSTPTIISRRRIWSYEARIYRKLPAHGRIAKGRNDYKLLRTSCGRLFIRNWSKAWVNAFDTCKATEASSSLLTSFPYLEKENTRDQRCPSVNAQSVRVRNCDPLILAPISINASPYAYLKMHLHGWRER